ncbi:hypothetical protein KA111_02270 [Candidatus Woesebacteria bacterium]|nr:hypothetical protein [Candidatus Woesebacteria bacterium]
MKISPASYWRNNKKWSNLVGKSGKVILSTKIEVTAPEFQEFLPYYFAIVEVEGKNFEFMGEKNEILKKGDKVKLALRKISSCDESSLINYGIKIV